MFQVLGQTLCRIHNHDEEPNVWVGPVRETRDEAIEAYRVTNEDWEQPVEGFTSILHLLKERADDKPVVWNENDVMLRVVSVPE